MSMPNIPDINPKINITLEDSINLLLTSIAEEEISISKLMDAEKEKILCVLDKYKNNEAETCDLFSVNNSVSKTVINLIKMQMLLQFKLDSVKELVSVPPPPEPCPPAPPPCCPADCKWQKYWCCLIGKSSGKVSNQSDYFNCNKAVLDAFVSSYNSKDNIICYQVEGECASLCLESHGHNIKIECPCGKSKSEKIKIWGSGWLTKIIKDKKTVQKVNFGLFIWDNNDNKDNKPEPNGFQIIIESSEDKSVIHNSGFVESHSCGKDLNLYCYKK